MKCFFFRNKKLELGNLDKRAGIYQWNANDPIEDRYRGVELKNFKGYFISVLDGHGGYQLAEFANKNLFIYFDNFYKEFNENNSLPDDDKVVNALNKAFDKVEKEYLETARELYKKGEGRVATVGSCASVILISPTKIYTAQLGDSKAKLYRRNKSNDYDVVKLTTTHNSEKVNERMQLMSEFKDNDIVICKKPNNKCCYVKGMLQPTRVKF
jgi:hypothetical protein